MSDKIINESINQEYKFGFVTDIEQEKFPPGLNEDVVRLISEKKNARMILPNMLTLIGVCIGLTSIRFSFNGQFDLAIIAIIIAALIDGLDGRIARLIKGTSKVGKELDSLTDMISFGVAPAFIMYFWTLSSLGRFGWLICLIYVICVALRLARFNVNTVKHLLGEIIFLREFHLQQVVS